MGQGRERRRSTREGLEGNSRDPHVFLHAIPEAEKIAKVKDIYIIYIMK